MYRVDKNDYYERNKQIIDLHIAGKSIKYIASLYSIKKGYTSNVLRNTNNKIRHIEIQLFLEEVDIKSINECWEWKRGNSYGGYGRYKRQYSHRIAYLFFKGEIEKGKMICHTCDNKLCCNPSHLYLGTAFDNAKDREQRTSSTKSRRTKTKIINLIKKGCTPIEISNKLNISLTRVYVVKKQHAENVL